MPIMSALGRILQLCGMAIMLVGFVLLVLNVQQTLGAVTSSVGAQAGVSPANQDCGPQSDESCNADLPQPGEVEDLLSSKITDFLLYLGAGLAVMFLGLLLRSAEEVERFFGGLLYKGKQKGKVPVGRLRGPGGFGGL